MEGHLEKLVLQFLGDTLDADVFSEISETSASTGNLFYVGFGEPAPLSVRQADALHPACIHKDKTNMPCDVISSGVLFSEV